MIPPLPVCLSWLWILSVCRVTTQPIFSLSLFSDTYINIYTHVITSPTLLHTLKWNFGSFKTLLLASVPKTISTRKNMAFLNYKAESWPHLQLMINRVLRLCLISLTQKRARIWKQKKSDHKAHVIYLIVQTFLRPFV